MRIPRWVIIFMIMLFMVGCDTQEPAPSETPILEGAIQPTDTTSPPTPVPLTPTPVPDPKDAIRAYLDFWKADDYSRMYSLLTTISKDAISDDEFTERYKKVLAEAAVSSVEYEILSAFERNTTSAEISYKVILKSVLVGDIQRDTLMNLSLENGEWRIQWADALILPELADGNYLWMDRHIPARATAP